MYTGNLVRLREYRKEDLPMVVQFMNDREIRRNLAPGITFPLTMNDEMKWFENNSGMSTSHYGFAIETLDDAKYIGGCGVHNIDWKNRHADVGIFIGDRTFLGKGYGTDAMKILTAFVFEEMNMHKIRLEVYAFNERAIRCYEKCGYSEEARFREELFRDGAYHDIVRMVLFRRDWTRG
jgi:RimJ/RimL family protein N-acetyltransferase